jgi:hypothetical protein
VGGHEPVSGIYTATRTYSVSLVAERGTMLASMSKTFMSPDFLTRFLEEYRELPVLWQVHSADYSNRAKRDEAWDLFVQFRFLLFFLLNTPHSSSIITAAATCFDELIWILKYTNKVGSPLMHVW